MAPVDGLVSPAYVVASPFPEVDCRYFSYLFRTQTYMNEVNKYSHGIVADRNRLYWDDFKQMPSLFPPSNEQKKIADFLDAHGRKVSRLVRIKRKQIELLRELKQTIISNAITRGVDPEVKLKNSGIDWLGDIPEDWDLVKLRFLSKGQFQYGANEAGIPYSGKLPRYIRITDISPAGKLKEDNKLSLLENVARNYMLTDGDILFARSGATVGKTFLFKEEYGQSCYAGYLIKFSPDKEKVIPQFVYFYTMSSVYYLWLNQIFIQSTIQNVSAEKYKNLVVPLPKLEEQLKILEFIDNETIKFDMAIEKMLTEIDLITEYRTRLITDVVTGKFDLSDTDIENIAVEDTVIFVNDEDVMDNSEIADLEECEV